MDQPSATVLAASVAALVAIITAALTWGHNNRTLSETRAHNNRTLNELRLTEKRKQLNAALQELLIPLRSQLNTTLALWKIFRVGKPEGFRTLTYLLDPDSYEINGQKVQVTLSSSDQAILREIIEIQRKTEELLTTKGGLVNDPVLLRSYKPNPVITDVDPKDLENLGLFAIATAHFRVLRMAFDGVIKGEVKRYASFVYPKELDAKVDAAITKAQEDLAATSTLPLT